MDHPTQPIAGSPAEQEAELAARLTDALRLGWLPAGAHLPTIRAMAAKTGVARHIVQRVYRRLASDGLVESTVGRGTVVRPRPTAAGIALRGRHDTFSRAAHAALHHLQTQPDHHVVPLGVELIADFANLLPDDARFPLDEFRQSLQRVLVERGGEVLSYGDPAGSLELREQVVANGGRADEVLITSGAQQGMDLVLRTFTQADDAVAVAIPTYHHLFGLLKCQGLRLAPMDSPHAVDAVLADPRVRLLYVMPTFHNPTGRTMDLAERQALMAKVTKTDVPVLEDEFELDLRFAGTPLPSLRELDPRGLTVTVRTFSKGLFPGVRIGWLQAAAPVIERVAALKRFLDLETSPLLQAALADLLRRGVHDRHLRALRDELRERHAAADRALARHMPAGTRWTRPEGGYASWVELPSGLDGDAIAARAAEAGVVVAPGSTFDPSHRPQPTLRLSLSRVTPAAIEAGIEVLGACASERLETRPGAASRPLFL